MAVEMKEIIAEAAVDASVREKGKVNSTIKDIVEECHITRQAFSLSFRGHSGSDAVAAEAGCQETDGRMPEKTGSG